MKIKIRSVIVVPCPKYKRIVPIKHYQTGVRTDEVACVGCEYIKSKTCNYIVCNYVE
jgi:hypothetical protein